MLTIDADHWSLKLEITYTYGFTNERCEKVSDEREAIASLHWTIPHFLRSVGPWHTSWTYHRHWQEFTTSSTYRS
jgi:hypothetical protein